MPAKKRSSGRAQAKVGKVMHEYKHGQLHSGSKKGPKVKNPKQAIAIALSEARASGANIPKKGAKKKSSKKASSKKTASKKTSRKNTSAKKSSGSGRKTTRKRTSKKS